MVDSPRMKGAVVLTDKGRNGVYKKSFKDKDGNLVEVETFYYDFQYNNKRHTGNTGCKTRTKADRFVDDLRRKLESEKNQTTLTGVSIDTHLKDYIDNMKVRLVPDYVRHVEKVISRFICEYNINALPQITPMVMNKYLATTCGKLSMGTKRFIVIVIKTFLKWAETTEPKRIDRSPLYGFKPPTIKKADATFRRVRFTADEINLLLKNVIASRIASYEKSGKSIGNFEGQKILRKAERDKVLFQFMYETCARTNDAATLKWNQIIFDDDLQTWKVLFFGKGGTEEFIPMRNELHDLLMAEKDAQAKFAKKPIQNSSKVFLVNFRSPAYLRKDCMFAGIRKDKTARDKIDLHCFRGSFATNAAKMDLHPSRAKEMLRHKSIKTTLDYYTDVQELRDKVGTMAAMFTEKERTPAVVPQQNKAVPIARAEERTG